MSENTVVMPQKAAIHMVSSQIRSAKVGTEDKVVFDDVSKTYPSSGSSAGSTVAIKSLNVAIKKAEIVSILGPTGCGKSDGDEYDRRIRVPNPGPCAA